MPLYRADLTADEALSVRHLRHFLAPYDRYLVVPESLSVTVDGFEVERFPDRFFTSAAAFATLQLRRRFYRRFAGYEHILMHQLDALVFSDRLTEFCAGDYDYIGAPWIDHPWFDRPAVGNGGFSLRRVESFLRVLDSRRYAFGGADRHWRAVVPGRVREIGRRRDGGSEMLWSAEAPAGDPGFQVSHRRGGNSDIFWSFDAPRCDPRFRIAAVDEALQFAFELWPRKCFELSGGALPFGCHAWARVDRAFWEPYLLR